MVICPYKKATYEDYVGARGLERLGKKKWRKHVFDVVDRLVAALEPDDIVLGGGNAKILNELPPGCRLGDNANAFKGGFLMWEDAPKSELPAVSSRSRGCYEVAHTGKVETILTRLDHSLI